MVKSHYGVMDDFKNQRVQSGSEKDRSLVQRLVTSGANRLENEQNVEETYNYAGSWDDPRLQLWARIDATMTMTLLLPSSTVPKRRKDTLTEALTGAAVALAKAVSDSPQVDQSVPQESPIFPGPGVSQCSNTIMSYPGESGGPPNEKI